MESRKRTLYEAIFEYIKYRAVEPCIVMCDYETAMRKAVMNVWPEAQTPGCTFHFRQAIRRQYQIKVNSKPKKNTHLSRLHSTVLLMVYNLQFLPADKILIGAFYIRQFQERHRLSRKFAAFNNYFARQWLVKVGADNFSMFKKEHRTNNMCEGFNSKLSRLLPKHPNIYAFLNTMVNCTKEENQKRPLQPHEINSRLSVKLTAAWTDLEARFITVRQFLSMNFYS